VSKSTGLILYPVFGAVVYTIVTVSVKDHTTHGSLGPATGLTIALVVMLAAQIGALAVAISRSRHG